MKKFYITTPIYYVNDRPHIGHAYTTIAADVLARFHRLKGNEVFFLTGTDEHGAKVAQSADQEHKEVKAFCDENARLFKDSWANLDISHDKFIRTTDPEHEQAVKKFMSNLQDQGAVYEGTYEGLYCTGCEKFITEKELVGGLCPDHKKPPESLKEKNYFFKLKDFLPDVAKMIAANEIIIEPAGRRNEVLGLIKQGLDDFSVSRESVKWGIPLPFDPGQVIYVWVEALQNYITAIGYGRDDQEFSKWWPADIHLMAKDIIKFHAIFWPALLIAAGLKPPRKIFAHGFFSFDGQKMSKSLGNVIDPNALVEEYGSDATRYLLLTQFPFGQDGDIKADLFEEKYNADLANGLGNLVARISNMIEKFLDGQVLLKKDQRIKEAGEIEQNILDLKFHEAFVSIWEVIGRANQTIDQEKPWELAKKDQARLEKVLTDLAQVTVNVADLLQSLMPKTAKKIKSQFLAEKIKKQKPLFPRAET